MKRRQKETKLSQEALETRDEFFNLIERLKKYATDDDKVCPLNKHQNTNVLGDPFVEYDFVIMGKLLEEILTGIWRHTLPSATYTLRMTQTKGSFVVTSRVTLEALMQNDTSKKITIKRFIKDYHLKVDSLKSHVSANSLRNLG